MRSRVGEAVEGEACRRRVCTHPMSQAVRCMSSRVAMELRAFCPVRVDLHAAAWCQDAGTGRRDHHRAALLNAHRERVCGAGRSSKGWGAM